MHDYAWAMLQMLPHSESHVKNESTMGPVNPQHKHGVRFLPTLWYCLIMYIAMENGPCIVDLPIENGDFPRPCYQNPIVELTWHNSWMWIDPAMWVYWINE